VASIGGVALVATVGLVLATARRLDGRAQALAAPEREAPHVAAEMPIGPVIAERPPSLEASAMPATPAAVLATPAAPAAPPTPTPTATPPAPPRSRVAAPPRPPATSECDPPYVVDPSGFKRYKRGCLR
jgi:hypothetical protein